MKNGDKVRFAGGRIFIYIGQDPINESYSYCLDLESIDQNQPSLNLPQVCRFPTSRLELEPILEL